MLGLACKTHAFTFRQPFLVLLLFPLPGVLISFPQASRFSLLGKGLALPLLLL